MKSLVISAQLEGVSTRMKPQQILIRPASFIPVKAVPVELSYAEIQIIQAFPKLIDDFTSRDRDGQDQSEGDEVLVGDDYAVVGEEVGTWVPGGIKSRIKMSSY